ncbi:DNA/RNA non-specific endonuclease [Campylobacter coli]|nr:DNA/RNA non-specific endonuclease [Campylobacter coli]
MKKNNKLEKLALKDFNSILYAKELKYDKINETYQITNCEIFTKNRNVKSCFKLEAENLKGEQIKKRPRFEDDTNIPKKYRTTWSDYKNSGYDRGHTISNASMRKTTQAQRSTFLMSNITPQNPQINQKVWNKIEKRERQVALKLGEIEVLNLVNYDSNPINISDTEIIDFEINNNLILKNIAIKNKISGKIDLYNF